MEASRTLPRTLHGHILSFRSCNGQVWLVSMFQKESLRAVIFDIDGTLVDSFGVYRKVFNEGIGDYNMGPLSGGLLDNYLRKGKGLREILEEVFPPGTDGCTIDACKDRIKHLFRQVEPEEINAFPGVEESVRAPQKPGGEDRHRHGQGVDAR